MLRNYRLRDYDFKLILFILATSAIGVLAIGSAKESLQNKQLAGVILGVVIMTVISLIDYPLDTHVLLAYVRRQPCSFRGCITSAGDDEGGAQRWLEIGGLRFQPSETAKIILILFFAQFIMKHREKLNTFRYHCVLSGTHRHSGRTYFQTA